MEIYLLADHSIQDYVECPKCTKALEKLGPGWPACTERVFLPSYGLDHTYLLGKMIDSRGTYPWHSEQSKMLCDPYGEELPLTKAEIEAISTFVRRNSELELGEHEYLRELIGEG